MINITKKRIQNIIKQIEYIQKDIKDVDIRDFTEESQVARAVCYSIIQIAEQVQKLDKKIAKTNPEIPYKDIVGMRIILVHIYDEINYAQVYQVAKHDVDILKDQLNKVLELM